ncbi:MAG: DNA replication and repair protein RecF, partial [Flavobacteriales bacterium]|nr:DNA replication and repair protein RecF [Flavobacteriales bacterium]
VISQTSAEYLEAVLSHSRLVEMRNALLKTQGVTPMQLDVYDMQMINYGRKIYNGRKSFLEKFIPIFQSIYSQISGGNEKADITYNSIFSSACVEEELRASRTKDLYLGFTSAGVHNDDLSFTLGGYPIKRYG